MSAVVYISLSKTAVWACRSHARQSVEIVAWKIGSKNRIRHGCRSVLSAAERSRLPRFDSWIRRYSRTVQDKPAAEEDGLVGSGGSERLRRIGGGALNRSGGGAMDRRMSGGSEGERWIGGGALNRRGLDGSAEESVVRRSRRWLVLRTWVFSIRLGEYRLSPR